MPCPRKRWSHQKCNFLAPRDIVDEMKALCDVSDTQGKHPFLFICTHWYAPVWEPFKMKCAKELKLIFCEKAKYIKPASNLKSPISLEAEIQEAS